MAPIPQPDFSLGGTYVDSKGRRPFKTNGRLQQFVDIQGERSPTTPSGSKMNGERSMASRS